MSGSLIPLQIPNSQRRVKWVYANLSSSGLGNGQGEREVLCLTRIPVTDEWSLAEKTPRLMMYI